MKDPTHLDLKLRYSVSRWRIFFTETRLAFNLQRHLLLIHIGPYLILNEGQDYSLSCFEWGGLSKVALVKGRSFKPYYYLNIQTEKRWVIKTLNVENLRSRNLRRRKKNIDHGRKTRIHRSKSAGWNPWNPWSELNLRSVRSQKLQPRPGYLWKDGDNCRGHFLRHCQISRNRNRCVYVYWKIDWKTE